MENHDSQPRTIGTWLESLNSSGTFVAKAPAEIEALAEKDEAILLLLSRLALVYWRPDFAPSQAKQLYMQYLEDLRDYALKDIAEAMQTYRRSPDNRFFPTPGQLRGIIEEVPSWSVTPKKIWIAECRKAAMDELQKVVSQKQLKITGRAA